MTSRGSACGKVILFGEHAVVYGIPAIAVGIDRGASAECTPREANPSTLRIDGWNVSVTDAADGEGSVAQAFRDLVAATRAQGALVEPVDVRATADLPPGGGLGCSAALGVAIARALDPSASPETVAERATAWERVFHGNPSGIDAATAALGGSILFKRGDDGTVPSIERVRMPAPLHLCVGNTGHASSTKSMVDAVARLLERRPETTTKAFDAIHTLVKNARLAIEAGDLRAIGQLLDLNQMLLSGLFVSSPEIEQMCATARAAGALGAKLTGAGGGGSVVALVQGQDEGARVLEAWTREGFSGFFASVGAPPVRHEAATSAMESSP